MSIEQLKLTAQNIANDPKTVGLMFFLLKKDDLFFARKAELSDDAQLAFTTEVKSELIEFSKEHYVLRDLSALDFRQGAIFRYNLPSEPSQLLKLIEVHDQTPKIADFNHKNDQLTDLKAIIVLIGNDTEKLAIYKHHYPTNMYRKKGVNILRRGITSDRFEKLDQEIIRMGYTIDFIYDGTDVFVTNFKVLEKFWGYKEAVKANSISNLDILNGRNLIDNIDLLKERISVHGDVTFARKVTRAISHSPVLATVKNNQIIQFIKQHNELGKKIKISDDGTKIILKTRISQNFFMKLLNDDYLKSELTKFEYDADIKDIVETTNPVA